MNAPPPLGRPRVAAWFAAAIALFLGVDLATDVVARMLVRGQASDVAVGEHLHYAAAQLAGTTFLALPFLGLAAIGLPVLRRRGAAGGALFLVAGALLLAAGYGFGYQQCARAMAAHHWTSAALSQAAIPFVCLPLLLVAFVVARIAGKARART